MKAIGNGQGAGLPVLQWASLECNGSGRSVALRPDMENRPRRAGWDRTARAVRIGAADVRLSWRSRPGSAGCRPATSRRWPACTGSRLPRSGRPRRRGLAQHARADAGQVAVGNGLDAQQFGVQQDHFGLVGGAAAFGQLRLEFDDQVVGQELAQAVGFTAVPDGLDTHELLLGLLEEADGVEVARHVPVAVFTSLGQRGGRARQQQPPQARREPPEPPEPAAASHATWAVAAAGRGLTRAAEGGLRGRTRAAPRRRRTMNNTAKTASAISNADDRNSAKAPDRPMLESSAAMPRPAAMPAMGPSQREAPLLRRRPWPRPPWRRRRLPARRWRRRCCCRRPAAWWPGAAGSRCWTDGPRCCRRQRGAPRRQTKPSPAPRRKRRSALRRKPRKTEFGHGWCAPRTREGGAP